LRALPPQSDERLLKLYESGLPGWAIYAPQYGVWYRPWMRRITYMLFVLVSAFSLVMGFYDLYKNVPYLDKVPSPRGATTSYVGTSFLAQGRGGLGRKGYLRSRIQSENSRGHPVKKVSKAYKKKAYASTPPPLTKSYFKAYTSNRSQPPCSNMLQRILRQFGSMYIPSAARMPL